VNVAEAWPLELVVTEAVANPENVPVATPAPAAGAVKVTVTPLTGFELLSFTVACSWLANAVFTVAVCGVPPVALIVAPAPKVFVRLKLAVADTPETAAVTL
jgi:hypothetical protein